MTGVAATRIPDGCRRVSAHKLLQVKTPFDFVVSCKGQTALIDTKTCKDTFAHSMIDSFQLQCMMEHLRAGVLSGYVIHFRDHKVVGFVSAKELFTRYRNRGSIQFDDPCVKILTDENKRLLPRRVFDVVA